MPQKGGEAVASLQTDLVNELDAALVLVSEMAPEAAKKHAHVLGAMTGLVRNFRGFVEAHGDDGRFRVTLDMGRCAEALRRVFAGGRR